MFRNLNNWKKWFMSLKGGMRIWQTKNIKKD
jgi:hypothetical protein